MPGASAISFDKTGDNLRKQTVHGKKQLK